MKESEIKNGKTKNQLKEDLKNKGIEVKRNLDKSIKEYSEWKNDIENIKVEKKDNTSLWAWIVGAMGVIFFLLIINLK